MVAKKKKADEEDTLTIVEGNNEVIAVNNDDAFTSTIDTSTGKNTVIDGRLYVMDDGEEESIFYKRAQVEAEVYRRLHKYDDVIRICQENQWGEYDYGMGRASQVTLKSIAKYCYELRHIKDRYNYPNDIVWPKEPDIAIKY